MIKRILAQQFPNMDMFRAGYKVRNHTGQIQQSGATCGPWSLWIAYAYAMNFRGCRSGADDKLQYNCFKQSDVMAFWKGLTF